MGQRSKRRRAHNRKFATAVTREMVRQAELRIDKQIREAGRSSCNYTRPASVWTSKDGTPHTIEPIPCGGRLKPIKAHGAVVEGVAQCVRCGRRSVFAPPAVEVDLEQPEIVEPVGNGTVLESPHISD